MRDIRFGTALEMPDGTTPRAFGMFSIAGALAAPVDGESDADLDQRVKDLVVMELGVRARMGKFDPREAAADSTALRAQLDDFLLTASLMGQLVGLTVKVTDLTISIPAE